MFDLFEKCNPSASSYENKENDILQEKFKEELYQNITLNSINEKFLQDEPNNKFIFIGRKTFNDSDKESKKKHTKFSSDNLKRECKHLVIENVLKFINNKIFEAYEGNIDNGLLKKKLMKLNQSQKTNSDVKFNQAFIYKNLKEILSQNITTKITVYAQDHNKKVIEKILTEKKEKFEKIFNITFIECVEHFIGDKKIEELEGLVLFNELKEALIKKNEKDGESYYENLGFFFKNFENIINRSKSRKKKKDNITNDSK